MYQYVLTQNDLSCAELGEYVSFGIRALDASSTCAVHIADVSTDAQLVRALVERCNAGQLEPVQLHEVVENAIAE